MFKTFDLPCKLCVGECMGSPRSIMVTVRIDSVSCKYKPNPISDSSRQKGNEKNIS